MTEISVLLTKERIRQLTHMVIRGICNPGNLSVKTLKRLGKSSSLQ